MPMDTQGIPRARVRRPLRGRGQHRLSGPPFTFSPSAGNRDLEVGRAGATQFADRTSHRGRGLARPARERGDLDRGLLRLRAGARRGVRPGHAPRTGSSTASWTTTSPRRTSAPAPACGCATCSRPGTTAAPPSRPTCPPAPGSAAPPATSPTSTRTPWTPSCVQRLGWASRRVDLEAGRYDTVLPPTAVVGPDDLRLLDRRRPRGARRPDGVLQARRRHPDRRAALRPAAADVLRPGVPPARGARRSSAARPATRSRASSTTACRCRAPTGSRDGTLTALLQNRYSAGLTGQPVTPYIDNLVRRRSTAPPAAPRTWSPASSAACW